MGKDYYREIVSEFYDLERENVESQFKDELNDALLDYWTKLGTYNWGCVTLHTLNVVYRTVRDPLY
jgi:hypothetical protein